MENFEKISRKLSKALEAKLNKTMATSAKVIDHFRSNDLVIHTNDKGEAINFYIGKMLDNGHIKGEYYTRVIKKRENGLITDSHWDNQGKVSGKI